MSKKEDMDLTTKQRAIKPVMIRYFKKASQDNAHLIAPDQNNCFPTGINQMLCKIYYIVFMSGNAFIYTKFTDKLRTI